MRTLPFLFFILSLGAIFYITGNKVNQYGASDPLLTLPTSQALIETGHTYLTHLEDRTITPSGRPLSDVVGNYQAARLNGNIVDVYSPGPALIVLPLTAVLVRSGYDFNDPDTNMAVQNRLAFLTSAIVLLSIYFLCRVRLNIIPALVMSHLTFFGSSIFANMGLAYFNLNIAVLFTCWVLILLAVLERADDDPAGQNVFLLRHLTAMPQPAIGIAIGICLFLAFIGRPSAAILIVITFGYLIFNQRGVAYFAMGSALACLAAFSLWSLAEYGEYLPIYFNPAKSNDAPLPLWVGIWGNLFSPSRGIFIFMPWLLLIPAVMLWQRRVRTSRLAVWIGLWFVLLLVTVSKSVIWWGGASFGPRLMAEIVPGLILLGVFSWAEAENKNGYWRPLFIGLFLLSGIFSVWVNSYQPFFNIFTGGPWQENITGFPVRPDRPHSPYFIWQQSQWLADADQICQQNVEMTRLIYLPNQTLFQDLQPNEQINDLTDNALNLETVIQNGSQIVGEIPTVPAIFEGFLFAQGDESWSLCDAAAVYFFPADTLTNGQTLELTISGRALNNQQIDLWLNDELIAQFTVNARPGEPVETILIPLETTLLKPEQINTLRFEFPQSQVLTLPDFPIGVNGKFGLQLSNISFNTRD